MKVDLPKPHPTLTKELRESLGFQQIKQPYIGPSNVFISQFCEREYALQVKYRETSTFPFETLLTFLTGFVAEETVKQACQQAGIEILYDQVSGIPVGDLAFTSPRGRGDLVLKFRNGDIVLTEIKAMDKNRYKQFRKYGYFSETAAHFQLLTYLKNIAYSPNYLHEPPAYGLIIGVSFDPLDLFDDKVIFSDEELDKYTKRLKKIDKVKEQDGKIIPERPFKRDSYICQSCTMYDRCWAPGDSELDSSSLTEEEVNSLRENIRRILYLDSDINGRVSERNKLLQHVDKYLELRNAKKVSISPNPDWGVKDSTFVAEIMESYDRVVYEKEFKERYPDIYNEIAPVEYSTKLKVYREEHESSD